LIFEKGCCREVPELKLPFALFFLAQGAEHPVRQHEPLDVHLMSDLSDHRRRHMQLPLNLGSSFRNSVVDNANKPIKGDSPN
jgi:hypothetical protein